MPNFEPDWNIAPTKSVPVLRFNAKEGYRQFDTMRWGLVPHFQKDFAKARAPFNARAETVAKLPVFRSAFRSRRCIVIASCFYEWRKGIHNLKQPMAIARIDNKPLAFAGLWESWTDATSGEIKRSFAIITTATNVFMSDIHDRMPVILEVGDHQLWLDESSDSFADLLRPALDERLKAWPVATLVNNVRNNGEELLLPKQSVRPNGGPNPL